MRFIRSAIIGAALFLPSIANAYSVSGTINGSGFALLGDGNAFSTPSFFSPGVYAVSFDLSRAAEVAFDIGEAYDYNVFDRVTGAYEYGENGQDDVVYYSNNTTHGSGIITVHPFQIGADPYYGSEYVREINYDGFVLIEVNYGLPVTGSIDYTIRAQLIADVPEPATWALMIAGFGLVGIAARRRMTALAA